MTSIPKIEFFIHEVFINAFSFPPTQKAKDIYRDKIKAAEAFLRSKANDYLERIEKFSGYEWKIDKIPVYLVPESARFKSFAKTNLEGDLPGVVLKTYPTMETLEFIFIHELCHINQMQSEFWSESNPWFMNDGVKNTEGIELCADIVMTFVLRDIYGKDSVQEKEMWEFLKLSPENVAKGEMLKKKLGDWDLGTRSLKSYL